MDSNKIIKYGLIILKDRKFLINREDDVGTFLMPGGKPEENEGIEECLIREMKEEHKCDLNPETIKFFGEFEDVAANKPGKIISMKVYLGEIKGEPEISSEIVEQKWFGKDDDTSILSPIIKNKIFPAMLEKGLI